MKHFRGQVLLRLASQTNLSNPYFFCLYQAVRANFFENKNLDDMSLVIKYFFRLQKICICELFFIHFLTLKKIKM